MSYIAGVRIHPGFFNQKRRKVDEYRVGDAPVRARRTAVPKPKVLRAKYAMPLVAVVAAVASFATGAAIATAAGATLGAMVVGGMMMVGAAMTVVGTVTGNKNLTKWGGIVSLVGGIGALGLGAAGMLTEAAGSTALESTAGVGANGALTVDGAGLASETGNAAANAVNDVAGGAASAGSAAEAAALPQQAPVTMNTLDPNAPVSGSGMVASPQTTTPLPAEQAAGLTPDAAAQTPMGSDVMTSGPDAQPIASNAGTSTAPAANTAPGVNTSSGVNTGTDGLTNSDAAAGVNGGKVATGDNGLFSRYEAWAAKNPNLNKTAGYVVNSVGGMISGRTPTAMQEAQINLYAEQAKLTEAQRQQLLTRMKNMSGVSSWKPTK